MARRSLVCSILLCQSSVLETSHKGEATLKLPELRELAMEQLENLHAIQGTDYHRDSTCFAAKRAAMAAPRSEPKERKKAKTKSGGSKKTPVSIKNALKQFPDDAFVSVKENGSTFVRCACCQFVCRSDMSKLKQHVSTPTHQSALAVLPELQKMPVFKLSMSKSKTFFRPRPSPRLGSRQQKRK